MYPNIHLFIEAWMNEGEFQMSDWAGFSHMKQKESEEHILRTNYAEKKAFFLCKSLLIQEYIQFGCEFLQIIFFPSASFPLKQGKKSINFMEHCVKFS